VADAGGRRVERVAVGGVVPLERRGLVDDHEGEVLLLDDRARLGTALDADELIGIREYDDEPRRASVVQLLISLPRNRLTPFVAHCAVAAHLLAGAWRRRDDRPQPVDRVRRREGDCAAIGLPGDDDAPVAL